MPITTQVIIILFVIWTFIYTLSYARYVWNRKNRLGAIAILLLALTALMLPVLTILIRG